MAFVIGFSCEGFQASLQVLRQPSVRSETPQSLRVVAIGRPLHAPETPQSLELRLDPQRVAALGHVRGTLGQ
jgi:hypothetical protein